MTFEEVIKLVQGWGAVAEAAIAAGDDVVPLVKVFIDTFAGEVSDEKLAELQATVDELSSELQKPVEDDPPATS